MMLDFIKKLAGKKTESDCCEIEITEVKVEKEAKTSCCGAQDEYPNDHKTFQSLWVQFRAVITRCSFFLAKHQISRYKSLPPASPAGPVPSLLA